MSVSVCWAFLLCIGLCCAFSPTQLAALQTFYTSTQGGVNWDVPQTWFTTPDPCTPPAWFGLECVGSVLTTLNLEDANLGTLPPEIADLTDLILINLVNTRMTGTLPAAISNLLSLDSIDLSTNLLTGTLPPEWQALTNTQTIYLHKNRLSGTLPKEYRFLAEIRQLFLYENQFTGTVPPEWSELLQVQEIRIAENLLTGILPVEWATLPNIRTINLGGNQLSGTLPPEYSALPSIVGLSLGDNAFTGTLPASWGDIATLQVLEVHQNTLTGTLPPEYGRPPLRRLYTFGNQLTGTLPPEYGALSRLVELKLSNNQLTGTLPPQWGSLSALRILFTGTNQLTGTLPPEWSTLTTLVNLDVSVCSLTGTLPASWGAMAALKILYVSYNQLSGTYPPSWTFPALNNLDLTQNNFCGPLPSTLPATSTLARLNHWDCPLPNWCASGNVCNGATLNCEPTPFGVCASITVGGDPHGFDAFGNPFEIAINMELPIIYRLFYNDDFEILMKIDKRFIREVRANIKSFGQEFQFIANLTANYEPQFIWNNEVLDIPVALQESGISFRSYFLTDQMIKSETGALAELARYQTIGIQFDEMFTVVGGYHHTITGFFNIQLQPHSDASKDVPSVSSLLNNHHQIRDSLEWNKIFSGAVVESF